MAYRINNKFVSREAYEAYQAKENQVTETTETVAETKTRNVSPRVAATRRLAKAEKTLSRAQAFWGKERKTIVPPSVEDAQAEYNAAADELKNLL